MNCRFSHELEANEAVDENDQIVRGQTEYGYHGSRKYEFTDVLAGGLPDDGGDCRHLGHHVSGHHDAPGADSAFRGITKILAGDATIVKSAAEFAGEGGLVVLIKGVTGWDTTWYVTQGVKLLRRAEAETAVLRRVATAHVTMIGRVGLRSRGAKEYLAVDWVRANE